MLPPDAALVALGAAGCAGALLMFIADLVLYWPARPEHRSAASYFRCIDPGGDHLHDSSMRDIPEARVMLGGVLGPVAAVLYALGFSQLIFGLQPRGGAGGGSLALPVIAGVGLATMMTVGGVYHALFAYTAFLAKEFAKKERAAEPALRRLLDRHRAYLRYVYKWAAAPGLAGSAAVAWCCLTRDTLYPPLLALLVPALSAPVKRWLKKRSVGGLVLCGGLTNLWNLLFLAAATVSVWRGAAAAAD